MNIFGCTSHITTEIPDMTSEGYEIRAGYSVSFGLIVERIEVKQTKPKKLKAIVNNVINILELSNVVTPKNTKLWEVKNYPDGDVEVYLNGEHAYYGEKTEIRVLLTKTKSD